MPANEGVQIQIIPRKRLAKLHKRNVAAAALAPPPLPKPRQALHIAFTDTRSTFA